MSKIIIFSDLFLPTFPYLEQKIYDYWTSKGLEVLYVLQEGDIRLTNELFANYYKSLNLKTIKRAKDIIPLFSKDDLLFMRFAYKMMGGEVAGLVREKKHTIVMYDPPGIDIRIRESPAQYLTCKSESLKTSTVKKFPGHYKDIFVVGTIHMDDAATTTVNKEEFMKSYGLDSNKKLVILTPANPGELGHQKGINNEYKQIVDIVKSQCPGYELVIKGHPLDYTASMSSQPGVVHKNEHYAGQHSWETFGQGTVVIRAEEGYKAFKACDVVLDVRSSVAMEAVLLKRPVLFVNRKKYTFNWPFDGKVMKDVDMGGLANALNTNKYGVDRVAYDAYCKREMLSDDGKAYERTADVVISLLK